MENLDIKVKKSWKKRGFVVGMIIGVIILFIFHLNDPYYDNTQTAKTAFWVGIVPMVIIGSSLVFFIIGLVIDFMKNKK